MLWLIGLPAAAAAGVFFVSWRLAGLIVKPALWDYDATYEQEIQSGAFRREAFENEFHSQEFYLGSPCGYPLHCMVLPQKPDTAFPDGRNRVAVIAHGFSYSLYGSVKYAEIFRDLGFSCVLFDQRNHGKSGKAPTTMGYYESRDLAAVCRWARQRFGDDCLLGTHGESMGAATVMLHAPTDPRLSFVIEDCEYGDLGDQLSHSMRASYHLPRWPFLPLASLLSRLRGGVFFSAVRPARAVAQCSPRLPMLFLHGAADDFVPTAMVHTNYDAKRGKKALHIFDGSEHARSWFDHPQQYASVVKAFLEDNQMI